MDAVRSVYAQTYRNWELILIDDGSTDGSLDVARSVVDARVTVVSDGVNRGLAYRLNQAATLAKYNYVARMDADDLMLPTRLQIQMRFLTENPKFDLISTGVFSVDNNLKLLGRRGESVSSYSFEGLFRKRQSIVHAAIIGRRDWFLRNQYDATQSRVEDVELWLRASRKNDFRAASLKEPLYIYREEGNLTRSKLIEAFVNGRAVINRYSLRRFEFVRSGAVLFAKRAVVEVLSLFNQLHRLQSLRNSGPISRQQTSEYEAALRMIRDTPVPGE